MTADGQPIGLHCPWCGEHAALVISDQQAFCETDGCQMLMWDPTKTRTELMFGDMTVVDLRREQQ